MKTVLILMASYNGEKFIKKQIDSIINQTYSDWKLIIQDDGSSDKTIEIIEKYALEDNRIQLKKNTTQYHGAFENFHVLINYAKTIEEYDYYMFCDQDDIWDENKIAKMIKFLEHKEEVFDKKGKNNIPLMCYADMRTIDGVDSVILNSLNEEWGLDNKNRTSVFFSHKVFGCNMMINRELFKLTPALDIADPNIHIMSHDNYYTKFAAVFGGFYYIPESLMDYRRHLENATSAQEYKVSVKRLLYRVTHIMDLSERHANIYNQSLVTIKMMRNIEMDEKRKKFVSSIERAINNGGFNSLLFVNKHAVIWGKKIENISRKIILVLGLYKKYLLKEY